MKKSEVTSKRFLILGAARTGIAAAKLLKQHNANVTVADGKSVDQALDTKADLDDLGITSVWGDVDPQDLLQGIDILIKSPGIPQDNPIVDVARQAGIRILSEIELASAFADEASRVIAITGTNGKTTTTAWLAHVLNHCGLTAIAAGNIGDAWCNQIVSERVRKADPSNVVYVVEVSSFQLENLEDFKPDVAVLTNITPDHMDRYDDRLDLYVDAKANVLKNLDSDDVFIWNTYSDESRTVFERSRASNWGFSATERSTDQLKAWLENGSVKVLIGDNPVSILDSKSLPLPGIHNIENALCVILAAVAVGANPEEIADGVKTFPGVEHRIELCGTRSDGVRFYNDSKATNLDAMEKALNAFDEPMVLIAGGRDAHSDFASISALIQKHVSKLVTLGEAASLIEQAWGDIVPTVRAGSMAAAVEMANRLAVAGNVVVLSPACKSFDMYKNYEERGRDFKGEVSQVLGL